MSAVPHFKMFIDGAWVEAKGGRQVDVVNPATEEAVAAVAYGDVDDAEAAVVAARAAFDLGPWPRLVPNERAAVLRAAAARLRERLPEIARWETLQVGKVIGDSEWDCGDTAYSLEYMAGLAIGYSGQSMEVSSPPGLFGTVVREPVGVVVGITPWNFPLLLAGWKFSSALAAGNVVIIKPATISPVTTLLMAEIFEEVGLPPGVFQVVVGPGASAGDYLAGHPLVDMVTLTGSVEVGRRVMQQASGTIKKVGLELGGKCPNVVFADADFEAAIQGVMFGAFANAGQVCCAGSRLIIERGIHDRFVAELVRRAGALRIGDGLDPDTQMGPLVSAEQRAKVESYVEIGKGEGATLACGGERIEGTGFFFKATIFTGVDNGMRVAQEEIFGPVLVVIPFDAEEEAIQIANDTIFGLAGGVWTKDQQRATRVARAIRAGTVYVNTYNWSPIEMPWGGYKQSGIGRELGSFGMDEFTEAKSIIVDQAGEPLGAYPAPEA
jgi:betaine-aldehyde dehydrogenase